MRQSETGDPQEIPRKLVIANAFARWREDRSHLAASTGRCHCSIMRVVLISIISLSSLFFVLLILFFIHHDGRAEPRRKLNATCNLGNLNGVCKSKELCLTNQITIPLEPCNEGDLHLVCCPQKEMEILNSSDRNVIRNLRKRTPGEKAKEMCKTYGKTAIRRFRNPAFIGPEFIEEPNCEIGEPLIKGGEDAKEKEFPHMAVIGNFNQTQQQILWLCGGSIVSPEFILSAAHCGVTKEYGYALVGTNRINPDFTSYNTTIVQISEIYIHPNYNAESNANDIALFKLSMKLTESERPICLDTGMSILNDMTVTATGFGLNKEQIAKDILQKVNLNIVDQDSCATKYKKIPKNPRIPPEKSVCAYAEGKDTCQGDSGGPIQIRHSKLQCMFTLIGVTSFGINCSMDTNIPGVYTKVSSYVGWIEDIVWPV